MQNIPRRNHKIFRGLSIAQEVHTCVWENEHKRGLGRLIIREEAFMVASVKGDVLHTLERELCSSDIVLGSIPLKKNCFHSICQTSSNAKDQDIDRVIPLVDIYNYNPWDLPQFAGERCPADTEQWFFFTARQERETRGGRPNRLTENGYWKATGSPCEVYSSTQNQRIGRKKTMVFYQGRAPNGRKTAWKMNEYKVFDSNIDHEPNNSSSAGGANLQVREEIRLCRIYKRSKCLRAFDRRPPTEEVAGGGQAAVHLHDHQHETTNDQAIRIINQENNNPGHVVPDQIISTNSTISSSGELIMNNNPSLSSQSLESEKYWDLATDNDPLWDWEDFNWFDI
ncbi:hypothetical protein DH2020_014918 [Rehmannia glutinosa]|uniref:NAC domain-containing protein n=1 Tax=Rehmannia glutinosa TaxID=99300 RepID=A0ABR0WZC4_REHGL